MENLKYPIGTFHVPSLITKEHLNDWITTLEELPSRIRLLVENLSEEQLDTSYRPQGWTLRQVVHHLADSHHHSYIRFKWALTEDSPIIKPYDEQAWANLPDVENAPLEWSLKHLEVVHHKLVRLLRLLNDIQLSRTFIHPADNTVFTLKRNVGQYAWHSKHHYAHIYNLLERNNWL